MDLVVNLILHTLSVIKFCRQEVQLAEVIHLFSRMEVQLERVDLHTLRLVGESVSSDSDGKAKD